MVFIKVFDQQAARVTLLLNYASANVACSLVIRNKLAEKRKLRKLWQRNRCLMLKTKLNPAIKELKNLLNCEKTVSTRISKQVKSFGFHCTNYLLGKATKKLKCPKHPSKNKMETGPI